MASLVPQFRPLLMLLVVGACSSCYQIGTPTKIRVDPACGRVYSVSRRNGERRLRRLAQWARFEDAWLCTGDSWLDIGLCERDDEVWTVPGLILPSLLRPGERTVIHYHIHPRRLNGRKSVPPSFDDLLALACLKRHLAREFNIGLSGIVADCSGIWSYDINPELQRLLTGQGPQNDARHQAISGAAPAQRQELAVLLLMLRHSERTDRYLHGSQRIHPQSIQTYIEDMAELGVLLRFDPW